MFAVYKTPYNGMKTQHNGSNRNNLYSDRVQTVIICIINDKKPNICNNIHVENNEDTTFIKFTFIFVMENIG